MTREFLINEIKKKASFLCIGLDSDIKKIPEHLLNFEDPIFEFNKKIIDATKDFCVAYKLNIAFYEILGEKGLLSLKKTIKYIPENIFTIADAKRGDIDNTSEMYAKTFFETYSFNSITITPYMGIDSVIPFLNYKNKWVILLALTSNQGSSDFQLQKLKNNLFLFEEVIRKSKKWGNKNNLMYVVGATQVEYIQKIRTLIPDSFLLVPGVGAQGGSLIDIVKNGINKDCGLLINSSRNIIYASNKETFSEAAKDESFNLQREMKKILHQYNII